MDYLGHAAERSDRESYPIACASANRNYHIARRPSRGHLYLEACGTPSIRYHGGSDSIERNRTSSL